MAIDRNIVIKLHKSGTLRAACASFTDRIGPFDLGQVTVMLDENLTVFMKNFLVLASLGRMFSSCSIGVCKLQLPTSHLRVQFAYSTLCFEML